MPEIIDVNWNYEDATGEAFDLYAEPDKVAAGLLLNEPVLVRFPNGRLQEGNRLRITPAGMEALRLAMPAQAKGHRQ